MGRVKNYHKILVFVSLSIIIVAVGLSINFGLNSDEKVDLNSICRDDDIGVEVKSKYKDFQFAVIDEVEPIIEKIKSTENHSNSVNCLYVLGRYNMLKSMFSDSSDYYNKLISVAESKNLWVDEGISSTTKEDVRQILEFNTIRAEEVEQLKMNSKVQFR